MTKPEPTFAVYFTEQELCWMCLIFNIAAPSLEDVFLDRSTAPPGTMVDREEALSAIHRGAGKLATRLQQIPSRN